MGHWGQAEKAGPPSTWSHTDRHAGFSFLSRCVFLRLSLQSSRTCMGFAHHLSEVVSSSKGADHGSSVVAVDRRYARDTGMGG